MGIQRLAHFPLTPSPQFSGDPDVFISCSLNATYDDEGTPSRLFHHYTWASTQQFGSDTISISHLLAESCVHKGDNGGTFYVAVYGYQNTTFTVTASVDNGLPTTLVDGRPQRGIVAARHYKQFQFWVGDGHQDLYIAVTPITGDPDLCTSHKHPTHASP